MADTRPKEETRIKCVQWSRILSIGTFPTTDVIENFRFKDLIYRKDYTVVRSAKVFRDDSLLKNDFVEIFCKVHVSALGKPLFECQIPKMEKSFIATTPTTVANKALSCLSHKKKWSGIEFFGFRRQDVQALIAESDTKEETTSELVHAIENSNISIPEDITTAVETNHMPKKESIRFKQSWVGIMSLGEQISDDDRYFYSISGIKKLHLPCGFISIRDVTVNNQTFRVYNEIAKGDAGPEYMCYTKGETPLKCRNVKPTIAVNEILKLLGIDKYRNWSGFEFFGLNRSDIVEKLLYHPGDDDNDINTSTKKFRGNANAHPELVKVAKFQDRDAGKTSDLKHKKSRVARNKAIHDVVKLASQDDVTSYISYLCEAHPELIYDGIDNSSDEDFSQLMHKLKKSQKAISVDVSQVASLLLGDCHMSQRKYKNLRKLLKKNNVKLPKYEDVSTYAKTLDVGLIHNCEECYEQCMGSSTSLSDTLQKIISSDLYSKMDFKTEEEQYALFNFLKEKDSNLFKNLDPSCKTIFLRQTGDNFRASARMPTEQISFSILNIKNMVNNPYGQFVNSIWRGKECRSGLEVHVKAYLKELELHSEMGIDLVINNELEHFNMIIFLVVDIGLLEKVLGKCSSTHNFGCYWCDMKRSNWDVIGAPDGEPQSIVKMHENGLKAYKELGENPSHESTKFKKFSQGHLGQHAPPMLKNCVIDTICPCSLHCILAHHRYLWKFLFNVISNRVQEAEIPSSLRHIGCDYLAYQYESYLKSKDKSYDGSGKLRMIGSDCKQLEQNIDKFVLTFLKENETCQSKSFEKFRQVTALYHDFKDLALDMRSTTFDKERASSFEARAMKFIKKLKSWTGGSSTYGLPYLHIMTRHIGKSMVIWGTLLTYGYGYFSGTAGEHLNKRIKVMEINDTNLDKSRFSTIIRSMRSKQFFYVDSVYNIHREMQCTRCHQKGHNRKNKCCPLHPSQPQLEFDATDEEN